MVFPVFEGEILLEMVEEVFRESVIDAAVIRELCVAEMQVNLVRQFDGLDVGLGFLEGDNERDQGGRRGTQ